jgi:hypothetical protein
MGWEVTGGDGDDDDDDGMMGWRHHLGLRVDHQRPPARLLDDDAVLDGDVVARQALYPPLPHLHRVHEHGEQRDVAGVRELELAELGPPLRHDALAERRGEGPEVRNRARGHRDIALHARARGRREMACDCNRMGGEERGRRRWRRHLQADDVDGELLHGDGPARLLAAEAAQQLVRALELALASR